MPVGCHELTQYQALLTATQAVILSLEYGICFGETNDEVIYQLENAKCHRMNDVSNLASLTNEEKQALTWQEINDKESIKDLMYLFQTADLVKFAKHSPLMNENDMNLVNAVDFINNTKVEPDPNAKPEPTEITVEEKRSKQGRMILLGSISIIVIAIVVILYKVLSGVYNLWF